MYNPELDNLPSFVIDNYWVDILMLIIKILAREIESI